VRQFRRDAGFVVHSFHGADFGPPRSPISEHPDRHFGHQVIRSDLYFRLKGWRIELPPLRERDVPHLARTLLDAIAPGRELSPEALAVLQGYSCPGNIRELETALERAVVRAGDAPTLEPSCFDDLEEETPERTH
jgi:transcriptional regulator with GAF, ATPase, and Fis domain